MHLVAESADCVDGCSVFYMQLLALDPVADCMHSPYMCCMAYLLAHSSHSTSQPKGLSADGLLVIKVLYHVPLKCKQPLASCDVCADPRLLLGTEAPVMTPNGKDCSFLCADRTMYAVHPIPLSEVKAVRKHTPSFGWQYIVLVLVNGLTLPPLYFGTGGVRALFATLKQVELAAEHACLQLASMSSELSHKLLLVASIHPCLSGTELHIQARLGGIKVT